jgi:hypothetical protein
MCNNALHFLCHDELLESILIYRRSRNSSVGIATAYGLDDRGSILGKGMGFFFPCSIQTGSGLAGFDAEFQEICKNCF